MAEDRKPKEETAKTAEAPPAKAPANKGRMLMLAGVVLVVMGASIGGTLTFLEADDAGEEAVAEVHDAPAGDATTDRPVAIYHNLKPPFIVNFLAGNKPRYLQAELTVVAREQAVVDSVVTYTPVIRSEVLNLFADQDYATLQTEEGKQALRSLLKDRIDSVLSREKQKAGVESVLFTSFVMQ